MHIAITGSLGSGKSEVLSILKDLGYPVLSSDEIVSQLYLREDIKQELVKTCGPSVLTCMNEVDKAYLSFRIFNHLSERKKVEALIHPKVYQSLQEIAKKYPLVFSEVPLLFETQGEKYFDKSLCIICEPSIAIERLMHKRHFTATEIKQRWASQMSIEVKIKRADDVIENNLSQKELKEKVIQYLHSQVL